MVVTSRHEAARRTRDRGDQEGVWFMGARRSDRARRVLDGRHASRTPRAERTRALPPRRARGVGLCAGGGDVVRRALGRGRRTARDVPLHDTRLRGAVPRGRAQPRAPRRRRSPQHRGHDRARHVGRRRPIDATRLAVARRGSRRLGDVRAAQGGCAAPRQDRVVLSRLSFTLPGNARPRHVEPIRRSSRDRRRDPPGPRTSRERRRRASEAPPRVAPRSRDDERGVARRYRCRSRAPRRSSRR